MRKDINSNNPEKHSQIFGTDIMTVSVGDPMIYHLLESEAGGNNKRNKTAGHYTAGHYWSFPGSSTNIHTSHNDSLLRRVLLERVRPQRRALRHRLPMAV